MQGTAIIIGNMIGGITGGGGAILPTFYILGDGTIDGDNIIDESGDFLVSELAPNPAPYLLDAYTGASAGYSLRRLSSTYTGFAIKVQDNVGGATLDVGFDINRGLDTAAIAIYGGVNDVFVETWYDQSGNGNNAVQATSANRPKIYDGTTGAVLTDNGKPAALFTGSQNLDSGTISATGTATNFAVGQITGGSGGRTMFYTPEIFNFYNGAWKFLTISSQINYAGVVETQALHYFGANSTQGFGGIDGGSITTNAQGAGSGTKISIGTQSTFAIKFYGYIQECIYYTSDQSANRAGIETNINNFYSIY